MTTKEFIKKYDQYLFVSHSGYNKYKSDLQSVIQDELVKFKDFFNSEYGLPMPIRDRDIYHFLKEKPF